MVDQAITSTDMSVLLARYPGAAQKLPPVLVLTTRSYACANFSVLYQKNNDATEEKLPQIELAGVFVARELCHALFICAPLSEEVEGGIG